MLAPFVLLAGLVCASGTQACKTADLAVSATPAQFDVQAGSPATISVTIENKGGDAANGSLTLYNPGFFLNGRVISLSGNGLSCPIPSANDAGVSCSFTALVAGTSRTLTAQFVGPVTIGSNVRAEIFATVKAAEDTKDPVPGNNDVIVVAQVTPGTRAIDIAVAVPAQRAAFREDEQSTFTVDVTNRGSSDASRVVAQINVASLLTGDVRVTGASEGWACGATGRVITCSRGALAASATSRLSVSIAPRQGSGELQWVVKAMADEPHRDANFTNNRAAYVVSVGSSENYARFLVPLIVSRAPGAHGSLWQTELRALSDSDADVRLFPQSYACNITCPPTPAFGYPLPRRGMQLVNIAPGSGVQGALLYARREYADALHFNLVVRDLSREGLSAGTEIPVVRESDLRTGRLHLMNIRIDPRFRHSLRIYDADARDDAEVMVRVVAGESGQLISEVTRRFTVDRSTQAGPFTDVPARPGYIEIGGLTDNLPELPNERELRVEITPLTAGLRYWAFVSTTNNETQQVTLITPQ